MKALLDTSVIVAGVLAQHPQHPVAVPWLRAAAQGRIEAILSAHSLAEVFAVLSSMPLRPSLQPSGVIKIIENSVLPIVDVIALAAQEYVDLISRMGITGLAG